GVRPLLGRDFTRDDAAAKRGEVLIGYDLWQARFGGAADVVGRSLWSSRQPSEIVGVLPRGFIAASSFLGPSSDGLTPDRGTLENAGRRDRAFTPYLRLKPGVTRAAALAEANALYETVAKQLPQETGGPPLDVRLNPLKEMLFGRFQDYLILVVA